MRLTKTLVATAAAASVVVGGVTSAGADPSRGLRVTITCGSGTRDMIVPASNGPFASAHVIDSTETFVPTAFDGFTGTLYDASGNQIDQFTDPSSIVKGMGARNAKPDVQACTFRFVEVGDGSDPDVPAGDTFVGTGGVRGFFRAG